MRKYIILPCVALIISACGGGSGGGSDTSAKLTRSDLAIQKKSLGSIRQNHKASITKGGKSSANAYNPNYKVDAATSKVAGNSMIKFYDDGRITLDWELCRTNADDCGGLREAVLQDKTVKYKGDGKSQYADVDAKLLYDRSIVTISDNQKIAQNVVKTAFGSLADTFDFHYIDSNYLGGASRPNLKGASWINVVDGKRDSMRDPAARNYWDTDGVKDGMGGKGRLILTTLTSKKNTFAKYARLGMFDIYVKYSVGAGSSLAFTNIDGTVTTAANLSKVGANYQKNKGWHSLGAIGGKAAYMRGDVTMTFNPSTKKLTKFDVSNMNYQEINVNRNGASGDKAFLSGKTLKLVGNTAIDYDNNGNYAGTLTENAQTAGVSGKWDVQFEGNFFGPNADETAGTITMHKNKNEAGNIMIGGYVAEKK